MQRMTDPFFERLFLSRTALAGSLRFPEVSLLLNGSASFQQRLERLHVIKEQTVVDHMLIVGGQSGECTAARHESEAAGHGAVVIDDFATQILLHEEHALVIGNSLCKSDVGDGGIGESGGIKSSHVMPVARKAFAAAKLALRTEDVDRRGLLPEGALGAHHLRRCRWKLDPLQMHGRVAANHARLAWLACGTCAEFQHDRGRDIACTGGQRCVVDEQFVALGSNRRRETLLFNVLFEPGCDLACHPI